MVPGGLFVSHVSNLREFACLTAVILTPLRVEAALDGSSATPVWLATMARLAKRRSMFWLGKLVYKIMFFGARSLCTLGDLLPDA